MQAAPGQWPGPSTGIHSPLDCGCPVSAPKGRHAADTPPTGRWASLRIKTASCGSGTRAPGRSPQAIVLAHEAAHVALGAALTAAGTLVFALAPYRTVQGGAGHLLAWISMLLPLSLWAWERRWYWLAAAALACGLIGVIVGALVLTAFVVIDIVLHLREEGMPKIKDPTPDMDPMDIRYNMINWVHRSTRGWSMRTSCA